MPPKVRITKENIVQTAVEIVRKNGAGALNARTVAGELQCSTQPLFSNFATMEELRREVLLAADALYHGYIEREIASGQYPAYKASGMAYIRFAKEEKELFKLLFMRDRSEETEQREAEEFERIADVVQTATGLGEDLAKLFHLEMWAYVHGIAAMTATGYLELEPALVGEMLTDAFMGMKKRYEEKGE